LERLQESLFCHPTATALSKGGSATESFLLRRSPDLDQQANVKLFLLRPVLHTPPRNDRAATGLCSMRPTNPF
jgi:hypothetical protein